jgi:hypothetical protein
MSESLFLRLLQLRSMPPETLCTAELCELGELELIAEREGV